MEKVVLAAGKASWWSELLRRRSTVLNYLRVKRKKQAISFSFSFRPLKIQNMSYVAVLTSQSIEDTHPALSRAMAIY